MNASYVQTFTGAAFASLNRLATIADELGAGRLARDARALVERAVEGRFYVACVGEFKRGKSTFINALVGTSVLPSGVVPVTTVTTMVRYGESIGARVRLNGGPWQKIEIGNIASYVAEDQNPDNAKGVDAVEVFVCSPLLADGMCLVDTPGIGSVFRNNAMTTSAFLPRIDVCLLVIGAEPPLSGDELDVAQAVAGNGTDIIAVLNKADRTSAEDRREAVAFASRMLAERVPHFSGRVFEVSATGRLAGNAHDRDWDELLRTLTTLGAWSRHALVRSSVKRGTEDIARRLLTEIATTAVALTRPLDECQQRLEAIGAVTSESAHDWLRLGQRMTAVQKMLIDGITARHRQFAATRMSAALDEISHTIAADPVRFGPAIRSHALSAARDLACGLTSEWEITENPIADARRAAEEMTRLTIAFLKDLAAEFPELGDITVVAVEPVIRRDIYPSPTIWLAVISPAITPWLEQIIDIVRFPFAMRPRAERVASRYLEDVLDALLQRDIRMLEACTAATREQLTLSALEKLKEAYALADRALRVARSAYTSGMQAVQRERARLNSVRQEVLSIVPQR